MTLISATEFAKRAGVSRAAVHRALHAGTIPGVTRVGNQWLIPEAALKNWEPPPRGRPANTKGKKS